MAGTVIIGCNQPNGIKIRLYDFQDTYQDVIGGAARLVKMPVPRGDMVVKLNGPSVPQGRDPRFPVIGMRPREGYALTKVDEEFATEWFKQNANTALVQNKVVIMHQKDTPGMAKEMKAIRNGSEPFNTETVMGPDGKVRPADQRVSNRIGKYNQLPSDNSE